mgnify:FL=1
MCYIASYNNEFVPGNCRYGWTKCLYQTTMPTWSIFNLATLEGTLKGLQLWCTSVWKDKHHIYVRNDDSSGFSEQRKSIESEFIQRCHPTFFTLYISMLFTFLCHASLIDAFDPNSQYLMFICRLRNLKFPRSLASAWIFQRPNHFSTGSEQKTNTQLVAHWQNDILCFGGHGGLVRRETMIRHNARVLFFMLKKKNKNR